MVEVESARRNGMNRGWVDDDALGQNHSGHLGHVKDDPLYSKNIGYPSNNSKVGK